MVCSQFVRAGRDTLEAKLGRHLQTRLIDINDRDIGNTTSFKRDRHEQSHGTGAEDQSVFNLRIVHRVNTVQDASHRLG